MNKLLKLLKKTKTVKNFRINKAESETTSLGVKGKKLGGAYRPIKRSSTINGVLQLEWSSGEVSLINLTSSNLENPEEALSKARKVSIEDKYAKQFVLPYEIKKPVCQFSQDFVAILEKKQTLLVEETKYLIDIEKKLGINKHSMVFSVSQSKIDITNSKGLELCDKFTSYGMHSSWDQKLFFSIAKRQTFNITEYEKPICFLGKLYKAINTPVKLKKSELKNLQVIISPEYTWELITFFILENLRGSLVANKMSRFTRKDFVKNTKILGDQFTLTVNPLQKLNPDASNFTSEGIRNHPQTFIEKGKLISPILDLKHAKKLRMEPSTTAIAPHITSLVEKRIPIQSLENHIKNIKQGIYIASFLGLHTQNSMTGDYSLPCPNAVYIKDGKLIGSLKMIIRGNIFEDFKQKLQFAKYSLFPLPGISYTPEVIIE